MCMSDRKKVLCKHRWMRTQLLCVRCREGAMLTKQEMDGSRSKKLNKRLPRVYSALSSQRERERESRYTIENMRQRHIAPLSGIG